MSVWMRMCVFVRAPTHQAGRQLLSGHHCRLTCSFWGVLAIWLIENLESVMGAVSERELYDWLFIPINQWFHPFSFLPWLFFFFPQAKHQGWQHQCKSKLNLKIPTATFYYIVYIFIYMFVHCKHIRRQINSGMKTGYFVLIVFPGCKSFS